MYFVYFNNLIRFSCKCLQVSVCPLGEFKRKLRNTLAALSQSLKGVVLVFCFNFDFSKAIYILFMCLV